MSLYSDSANSGLTAAQLAALVDDSELTASQAAIVAAIQSTAAAGTQVNSLTASALSAILAKLLAAGGVPDAVKTTLAASGVRVSTLDAAIQSAIATAAANQVVSAGIGMPGGAVTLVNTTNGLAPAGHTKASGISAQPPSYGQLRFMATNGAVYGIGPNNSTKLFYSNTAQYYDVATCMTVSMSPFPLSGYLYDAALATEDSLWVFGSANGASLNSTFYRYAISTNTWSAAIANAALSKSRKGSALLGDGKMLVFGGSTSATVAGNTLTNTVQVFDPAAGTWTNKANAPVLMAQPSCCLLADGRVFVMAYYTSDGTTLVSNSRRCFVYDPVADSWTEKDQAPQNGQPYLMSDGRIGCLTSTLSLSQAFDRNAAVGTQWAAFPVTAPVISGTAQQGYGSWPSFTRPLNEGWIPFAMSSQLMLYTTGLSVPSGASAFYVSKN